MAYISMCGPKGYGFVPFWSQEVYIDCSHFGYKGSDSCTLALNWALFLEETTFSSLLIRPINKSPSQCLSHGSELGN